MDKDKHLGIRIDVETHRKLKHLSEYEGRSINREVLHLIRKEVREFERINGEIK